jgi:uracil-DNA glycosylase
MPTWRNTRKLLELAEVDRAQVFFTNIFSIGLMEGESAIATFPEDDPSFGRWCRPFLDKQVRTMNPRVVVALGGESQRKLGVRPGVVIRPHPGVDYTLVGLQHTSSPTYYMRLSTGRLIDREAALLKQAAGPHA